MPEYAVYLLFALGAILMIGGFANHERFEFGGNGTNGRTGEQIRVGIHRLKIGGIGGIVLGAIVIGVGVYGGSPSSPDPKAPEPAPESQTVTGRGGYRVIESDVFKINLPVGWTAVDASGLEISDLEFSGFPRPVRSSILAIPTADDKLRFFAFDENHRTTLVIFSSGNSTESISTLLERRESQYNWSGVPVTAAQAGLTINGMDAGTLVTEPIHRYELFREKQYIVATGRDSFYLYFATSADLYQDREPIFEEIAGSFDVLLES